VFATVRRRAVDLARRNDRRAAREVAAHAHTPSLYFDPQPEDAERGQYVQQALEKLTPAYREVVLLKIWGELTFSEIAQALEIPPNTAASRYRYGLELLRQLTRPVLHER
jgi:RNA polymerase sigma-70 factor (ECF subfamily)